MTPATPVTPAAAPPASSARPAPPRDATRAVLTDHAGTLASLADLPVTEHAAVLARVHDDLADALRQAES